MQSHKSWHEELCYDSVVVRPHPHISLCRPGNDQHCPCGRVNLSAPLKCGNPRHPQPPAQPGTVPGREGSRDWETDEGDDGVWGGGMSEVMRHHSTWCQCLLFLAITVSQPLWCVKEVVVLKEQWVAVPDFFNEKFPWTLLQYNRRCILCNVPSGN